MGTLWAKNAVQGRITPEKKCERGETLDNQLFPDPIHADRGGVAPGVSRVLFDAEEVVEVFRETNLFAVAVPVFR
jgi:hypothetical protein